MNLKVLIIDDDEVVVFIQRKMMTTHDITDAPKVFKRALPALTYIEENQDEDLEYLILLDINMPGMSGWEFLDELKKKPDSERYHVIMVTSSVEERDKKKASKYKNVREFLEKPINKQSCDKIKEIPELSHFFQSV